MSKEERNKGLTWISDERKAHLNYLDQIVENRNLVALYDLKDNSEFSTTLHQMLVNKYDENKNSLNQNQMTLFLCMHLENSGQSSSTLSFFQEWFPEHTNKVVSALKDIGAFNSSIIIEKAIKLLPEDGSWFCDVADENTQNQFDELDKQFSNYPDNSMPNLYRKFAEKWKGDIISGITEKS
jgi:hypothetical protein